MYTTSWGIIFLGMPATPIGLLLIYLAGGVSISEVAHATAIMLMWEALIAFPLLFTAKWLSGPMASAWWKIWRV